MENYKNYKYIYIKPRLNIIIFTCVDVITKSDWCIENDPPENGLETCFNNCASDSTGNCPEVYVS